MTTIDAEKAMNARDNRVCECGHKSISHGSYSREGEPVSIGNGPCGIDRDTRTGIDHLGDRCPCQAFAAELDPYPYRIRVRQDLIDPAEREEYAAARDDERISSPGWVTFWDAEYEECIFDPRPEYSQTREDYPA